MAKIHREQAAIEATIRMLKAGEETRAAYDEAGMEYPEPLRRLIGSQSLLKHHQQGQWICPSCEKRIPWSFLADAPLSEEASAAIMRACELTHRAECPEQSLPKLG